MYSRLLSCIELHTYDCDTYVTCNGDGDPDLPSGGGNYRCGGE